MKVQRCARLLAQATVRKGIHYTLDSLPSSEWERITLFPVQLAEHPATSCLLSQCAARV